MSARGEATILESWTRQVITSAGRCGLDERPLMEAAGLDPSILPTADGRISLSLHNRVWAQIQRDANDESIGLRMAEYAFPPDRLGISGHLLRNASTLGDLLDRLVRFRMLINESSEGIFELVGNEAVVRADRVYREEIPRIAAEHDLGVYLTMSKCWLETPVTLNRVHFVHPAPRAAERYEVFFGAPVHFSQNRNELAFPREQLDIRVRDAQTGVVRYLEPRATELLDALAVGPFVSAVRRAIRHRLGGPELSAGAVGRAVGVSQRTLQRRLHEVGIRFKDLVEDTRRGVALKLMDDGRVSVKECAARTSFASSTAFARAFQHWTGETPSQYRNRRGRQA